MKMFWRVLLFVIFLPTLALAQTKISQLPDGGTLELGDQIPIARGATNYRISGSAFRDASNLTGSTLSSSVSLSSLTGVATITSGVWHGTPIANAYLANPATTVNGVTCTLGSTCSVTSNLTVGSSTIASGTNGYLEYNNSVVLGEEAASGLTVGTANHAPASGITGTTLATNVVTSSLTTVGTIGTGVWNGTAITGTYLASIGTSSLSATGTPSSSTFLRGDNTWAAVSGSGTVTSIATTSPITGGTITTTGTIACGSCVTSSSPGAGVAHFAGSTQAVTSSAVSLTADVSGVLPVANGGTNASSASITAFNNITGYTASGATGTTSTNVVFSTSPSITTPTFVTSAVDPLLIGGSATSATLTLESTSGSGATDKIIFDTGSQAQAMQINTAGIVSIGTTTATASTVLDVVGHMVLEGVTTTGATGTGNMVFASSPSIASPTFTGTVAGANTIPLSILAQVATNTVLGNSTSGTANVAAMSVSGCSSSSSALIWTTNTGFGCNTSIAASTATTAGTLTTALSANQLLGSLTAVAPTGQSVPSCSAAGDALLWTSGTGFSCATGYSTTIGTVTAVSVATANGVSGTSSGGATPALTIALGAITPTSVANSGTETVATSVAIGSTSANSEALYVTGGAAADAGLTTLSISTATFTPTFNTSNDFSITLVHASCPCTLANPSGTITPGQHGIIYVIQSATGSDTIGTWGSEYLAPGGTSSITLSAGANAVDLLSYAVKDATHIVIAPVLNVSH